MHTKKIHRYNNGYTTRAFRDHIGKPVIFTTYDGEQLIGILEQPATGYPRARFADGTWGRLDDIITAVVDA